MESLLILAFPMCLFLAACGDMKGDPPHGTPENKSEFLNEFAERTGPVGKGYLTIHDDGSLRYVETINSHCIFEYIGRIDIVNMDASMYDVTYRYVALNAAHRTCRERDPNCQSDFQACQQAESKANSEIGKLKNQKITKGSSPSSVKLVP